MGLSQQEDSEIWTGGGERTSSGFLTILPQSHLSLTLRKYLTDNLGVSQTTPPMSNPKGNQPYFGRTDVEAEAPVLWLPNVKS